ncbi:DivIVA domain-containing protein [Nocardioides taihuensis]|uniref:DivIVA domain-containing protein n=1 Tax=Nocardioides taihuensis TaxID=1835606 RepID=A0ABW0BJL6_9ACTN
MMWLFAILLVLAMGGIALLAAGKGTPMSEVYDDRPDALVPAEGDLTGDDLRKVRFSLAFRGYRMSEVDALLERLASQVDAPEGGRPTPGTEPAHVAEPATDPVPPGPVPVAGEPGAHRAEAPASEPVDLPTDQPAVPPVGEPPMGEPSAEGRGERRSD